VSAADSGGGGRRTAGFVIGGVGVVALGVGGFFGLRAFSKWGDRNDHCVGGCDSTAKTAGNDAKTAATISNIGIGLGVVAVGVGTYMVLSAKSASQPSAVHGRSSRQARAWQVLPTAGPTGGGLVLQGAY
jgi:hypothetical protein